MLGSGVSAYHLCFGPTTILYRKVVNMRQFHSIHGLHKIDKQSVQYVASGNHAMPDGKLIGNQEAFDVMIISR